MTASIYLHIPFCAGHKCDYCDFYSIPVRHRGGAAGVPDGAGALFDRTIDTLLGDIRAQVVAYAVDAVPSVYVGGGTPSVLGPARVRRLLGGIRDILAALPTAGVEITLEANPETATDEFLAACIDAGVTRLSVGIQTFHAPSRRAVRRAGDEALLDERLGAIAGAFGPDAGARTYSVDLMTGLPFQERSTVIDDVSRATAYRPGHVSLYALTVEPGTPLARSPVPLPASDAADDAWIAGRDALEAAGYGQYEVSNFALPGREARHNVRYWRMESWLAAGPSASATVIDGAAGTARRFTYPPDLPAYLAGAPPVEELLDPPTLLAETLMMGFRYRDGPDPARFVARFGRTIEDTIPRTLARWRPWLRPTGSPALTPAGLLLEGRFITDALAEQAGE